MIYKKKKHFSVEYSQKQLPQSVYIHFQLVVCFVIFFCWRLIWNVDDAQFAGQTFINSHNILLVDPLKLYWQVVFYLWVLTVFRELSFLPLIVNARLFILNTPEIATRSTSLRSGNVVYRWLCQSLSCSSLHKGTQINPAEGLRTFYGPFWLSWSNCLSRVSPPCSCDSARSTLQRRPLMCQPGGVWLPVQPLQHQGTAPLH